MYVPSRLEPSVFVLALCLSATAFAEPITITGQTRTMTGQSSYHTPDGDTSSGPQETEVFPAEYGLWDATLVVPGAMGGNATQNGGFNGSDTITLHSLSMNMSGGGGPGSSGSGILHDEFAYSFTVGQGAEYTFNLSLGCAGPGGPPGTTCDWSIVAFLRNDSGDVFRFETGPEAGYNLIVNDVTGTLNAGEYTLSLVVNGSVSFDAGETGGGWGGGAGNPTPAPDIMVLTVTGGATPPACPADIGVAGGGPGQDGQLNNNDFIAFISYFFNQNPIADMGVAGGLPGSDGRFDNNDFIAFIGRFFDGC